MNRTPDATEYDSFDFKHYDDQPLSLDAANKKALELRAKDPKLFVRIVPADRETTSFYVESRPLREVYADLWEAMMVRWRTFGNRARRLR